ncbi:hypothetical protein SAMN05216207_1001358 [Pseudonocardia ammonioxydans]|uniref:Uncharacterized protein n=1 Tax=Pseudonocardia ammonioxydans TaxID=260086 RepID=A0A1I4SC50_PSUAM|nr:hypothetical protein [Pseudonocardia ammonioxydans]SFM62047.1 hypothetical protein SAMN05216207_1001358 [Pseudonocardia ammonioxydans]
MTTAAWVLVAVVVWVLLGLAVALVLGRVVRMRDRQVPGRQARADGDSEPGAQQGQDTGEPPVRRPRRP